MNVLCLDPSLTCTGWGLVNVETNKILDCGAIETKPEKTGLKCESDDQRLYDLSWELCELIDKNKVEMVVYESPVGSKSSRAMQALSFVKGIVVGIVVSRKLDSLPLRARNIKKSLTGNPAAEKEELLTIVQNSYPEFLQISKKFTKAQKFAASDAISVYIAYKNSSK
jgi:crossover junction endodeoxyribonuclease RuvC